MQQWGRWYSQAPVAGRYFRNKKKGSSPTGRKKTLTCTEGPTHPPRTTQCTLHPPTDQNFTTYSRTAVQQYSLAPTASRKSTKAIKSTSLTMRRRTRRIQSKKSPVEKGRFRLAESDCVSNGLIDKPKYNNIRFTWAVNFSHHICDDGLGQLSRFPRRTSYPQSKKTQISRRYGQNAPIWDVIIFRYSYESHPVDNKLKDGRRFRWSVRKRTCVYFFMQSDSSIHIHDVAIIKPILIGPGRE